MTMSEPPLIDMGIIQGAVIDCGSLPERVRGVIQDCRAVRSRRSKPVSVERRLLVLSQNCDIENSQQNNIEVLATPFRPRLPGNSAHLSRPRDYRKLYLPYRGGYLECQADLISVIPKSELAGIHGDRLPTVSDKSRQILLDWRVGSYRREPLPNNFNQPFFAFLRDEDVGFGAFLERNFEEIADLFLTVVPDDREVARYDVSMTAVLSDQCPPALEESIREQLLDFLKKLDQHSPSLNLVQSSGEPLAQSWPGTTMDIVANTDEFSLWDINRMKRFNTDFLCYPEDEVVSDEDVDSY